MIEDEHEIDFTSRKIRDCSWEIKTIACDERNNLEIIQISAHQDWIGIDIGV